jgi:glycyl-tRNA synthetase beta chain
LRFNANPQPDEIDLIESLIAFFHERLKVQLRESGVRHDLVDAVLSGSGTEKSDLLLIERRISALTTFLATEDGKNLVAGYNRAANILKAEEKKTGENYSGGVDFGRLEEPEEIALAKAIEGTISSVRAALAVENFASAMTALASLRAPVDAFFDKILVNSPDPALRLNRLKLLNRIREACQQVADFSKIA